MKIGSKIHPRTKPTRNVTVFGKEYVFAPVKDKHDQTHYVADVTDEKHVDTLIDSGWFYVYGKDQQVAAALKAPVSTWNDGDQSPPPPAKPDEPLLAEATELLKGSISEVGKAVASVKLDVVRAAIALENGQQAPRKGMVALLEATLAVARAGAVG